MRHREVQDVFKSIYQVILANLGGEVKQNALLLLVIKNVQVACVDAKLPQRAPAEHH